MSVISIFVIPMPCLCSNSSHLCMHCIMDTLGIHWGYDSTIAYKFITQILMSVHQVHVTLMLCVLTLMGPSHALALEDSQEMDSCVKVNRA